MFAIRKPVFSVRFFSSLVKKMEKASIVPDVIDVPPRDETEIAYPSSAIVDMGNILTPTQVKDIPDVKWKIVPNCLYTLCMTDPDAPSRQTPEFREWHHWLVVNIPGCDISKGETLSEYIGSGPPKGTGLHRYVFLIYKQGGKIEFDGPRLTNRSGDNRANFSIKQFAEKYHMGNPISGNYFCAEWDDYVPILYKQLGA